MRKNVNSFSFFLKNLLIVSLFTFTHCARHNEVKNYNYYQGWEKGEIMLEGSEVVKVNPEKFIIFSDTRYAKDNHKVFYRGRHISTADPLTFKVVDSDYAEDKYFEYRQDQTFLKSYEPSGILKNPRFKTDGKAVFYDGKNLQVEARKFKIVKGVGIFNWGTDGKSYYFGSKKMHGADWESFVILAGEGEFSKDKQWVYYENRKLNYNVKGEKIIDTIDAPTFQNLTYRVGRDKFGYIDIYSGRFKNGLKK
ncbi:hypothetical protein CNR22_18330 [Sphingobacteriaceae bacterium]|nr:hypothetical protein CNR22_18330 [Sphingobacteriaceae bacterium]